MKVLFVTNKVSDQKSRLFLYKLLESELAAADIKFSILAFEELAPALRFQRQRLNLNGAVIRKFTQRFVFFCALLGHKPDHLLIGGYGNFENWLTLVYAKFFRKKITLWSGAGPRSSVSNSVIKLLLKKMFVRWCDSAVTYGTQAKKYLVGLGMPATRVFSARNVSHVEFFRSRLLQRLSIDPQFDDKRCDKKVTLIFAGRLTTEKGVEILCQALRKLDQGSYRCFFAGAGELHSYVAEQVATGKISGELLGSLEPDELSERFLQSDIYVLPTLNDPFSRTLSEALASGCFALNSCYDDASQDLINASNGRVFDPLNQGEFLDLLQSFTSSEWQRPLRSEISHSLSYDSREYARTVVSAIKLSLSKG